MEIPAHPGRPPNWCASSRLVGSWIKCQGGFSKVCWEVDFQRDTEALFGNMPVMGSTGYWGQFAKHINHYEWNTVRKHNMAFYFCKTKSHSWTMIQLMQDFSRRVRPEASVKAKDGFVSGNLSSWNNNSYIYNRLVRLCPSFSIIPASPQKNAQLDEESQLLLHDITCLWHWLKPKMESAFPATVIQKFDDMFFRGTLSMQFIMCLMGIPSSGLRSPGVHHQWFSWKPVTLPTPGSGGGKT